jgi:hypothetical protein
MELDILDRNQRKLPCVSLYRTLIISTPVLLFACKKRFLHDALNVRGDAYKLRA